jgi:hypothetical protein
MEIDSTRRIRQSRQTLGENRNVEVAQQTKRMASELQIGEQLGLMQTGDLVDSFQFKNYGLLDQHIVPEGDTEVPAPKGYRDHTLSIVGQADFLKHDTKAFLVHGLQQTGPEFTMHFNTAADNPFSQGIEFVCRPFHVSSFLWFSM